MVILHWKQGLLCEQRLLCGNSVFYAVGVFGLVFFLMITTMTTITVLNPNGNGNGNGPPVVVTPPIGSSG